LADGGAGDVAEACGLGLGDGPAGDGDAAAAELLLVFAPEACAAPSCANSSTCSRRDQQQHTRKAINAPASDLQ
jgi:hypothetical protein